MQQLAQHASMSDAEKRELANLDALDQAAVAECRLGGPERFKLEVSRIYSQKDHYALSHAMLASLPIREVVTTNYDRLFELASEDVGNPPSVLPRNVCPEAKRWLLKMHRCVKHPEDIVLTRGDYVSYDRGRQSLAGIVQSLLITRHMLFVGFSLTDDNFYRIADAVRQSIRSPSSPAIQPFGTATTLVRNALIEPLWQNDLVWVPMIDPTQRSRGRKRSQGMARRRGPASGDLSRLPAGTDP